MILTAENLETNHSPSWKQIEKMARRLRSFRAPTFMCLEDDVGRHVQVAGGGITCMVEKSDNGKISRAFSNSPSVSTHPEGTALVFGGGQIKLHKDEWMSSTQALEILKEFYDKDFDSTIEYWWREVDIDSHFVPMKRFVQS